MTANPAVPTAPRSTPRPVIAGLTLIVRLGLGGILFYAGALKVINVEGFVQHVDGYQLFDPLPTALVAVTLPWVACVVGLSLVLGFWTRSNALAAVGLVALVTAATASAAHRELNISCGCFSLDDKSVVTWRMVVEHGLMIVPALFLLVCGTGRLALDSLWPRIRPDRGRHAPTAEKTP